MASCSLSIHQLPVRRPTPPDTCGLNANLYGLQPGSVVREWEGAVVIAGHMFKRLIRSVMRNTIDMDPEADHIDDLQFNLKINVQPIGSPSDQMLAWICSLRRE
jgi:hypothetical protein